MTLLISGDGSVFSSLGDAKVGRWCKAPEVPDRCYYCWDKETMLHNVAVAYRTVDGWRRGLCAKCAETFSDAVLSSDYQPAQPAEHLEGDPLTLEGNSLAFYDTTRERQ